MSTRAATGRKRRRSDALSREDVVRLALLRMSAAEIAAELDAAPDTVSSILREPAVVEAIDAAERTALEDAQKGLRTLTRKAMRRLAQLVDSKDERISLAASTAVLTKAGADAPAKSEAKNQLTGADGAPLMPSTPISMAERKARALAELAALEETERDLEELTGGKAP